MYICSLSICRVSVSSRVLECPLSAEPFVRWLRRHAATLPFFLDDTFSSLISYSSCDMVTARMDWAADKSVWVFFPRRVFVQGRVPVYTSWLILRIESVVICCGMRGSQPYIILNFMGGVEMGDGSDGSGDWGL